MKKYCCKNCFSDCCLQEYIENNNERVGNCNYCGSISVKLCAVEKIGKYIQDCLPKAYEPIDEGTGAMYDSEVEKYYDNNGNEYFPLSIMDILKFEEDIFGDHDNAETLLEDMFKNVNSNESVKDGNSDIWSDIECQHFSLRDNIYGEELLPEYKGWEEFKHSIKHYSRFMAINGSGDYFDFLERFKEKLKTFKVVLPVGTKLYRARKEPDEIKSLSQIKPYKDLGPAPPKCSHSNRMSPAGIPCLYLASDIKTAVLECRLKECNAVVAEYELKQPLKIIDFTKKCFWNYDSIFSKKYSHYKRFVSRFLNDFAQEISAPIDEKNDPAYEYIATQILSEYIRSLGFYGICYESSVSKGKKSYAFFYGPDPDEYQGDLYPYPYGSCDHPNLPILTPFTQAFKINKIEELYIKTTITA